MHTDFFFSQGMLSFPFDRDQHFLYFVFWNYRTASSGDPHDGVPSPIYFTKPFLQLTPEE